MERSYAKWIVDDEGRHLPRYLAIEPARTSAVCSCGKETCPRGRLLDLRDHVAELYRVLLRLHEEDLAWEPSAWASVLYALRIAASIEDVEADTAYVEDPMVFALCEPTIDYENAQSEMASKYVAGATTFNFVWQAYEAVVTLTARGELVRLAKEHRNAERGRRLLEARPLLAGRLPGTSDLVKLAMYHCSRGGLMDERCRRVKDKYGDRDLVAAAELAREFRNFLFHGGDEVPSHGDWGDAATAHCRLHRFYSVSRLVLYLIQAMAWIGHDGDFKRFEYGLDGDELTARQMLERLQFKGPGIWPPLGG